MGNCAPHKHEKEKLTNTQLTLTKKATAKISFDLSVDIQNSFDYLDAVGGDPAEVNAFLEE